MEIKLNKNKTTIIDDSVYDIVKNHTWHVVKKRNTYYVRTNLYINKKVKPLYLHRLILNAKTGEYVDHINGNGLDNRKSNLRICTNQQNIFNQKLNIRNTSGYKGVHWSKTKKKWCVQITKDKKKRHLGYFKCKIEAAKKYNEVATKLYGKFAKLNNI